ncbi:hypothetical protein BDV98DRAFT_626249 [Pterulicium gracile]|uniref:Uncharacterized protein n=1 Tax=Pterulicium gracile TaxID=1884261 RepID=A0A5C3QDS9_9AGAR|nr:hypothetical protein BDV98DRAFT_626249 [Pterula gracilis]
MGQAVPLHALPYVAPIDCLVLCYKAELCNHVAALATTAMESARSLFVHGRRVDTPMCSIPLTQAVSGIEMYCQRKSSSPASAFNFLFSEGIEEGPRLFQESFRRCSCKMGDPESDLASFLHYKAAARSAPREPQLLGKQLAPEITIAVLSDVSFGFAGRCVEFLSHTSLMKVSQSLPSGARYSDRDMTVKTLTNDLELAHVAHSLFIDPVSIVRSVILWYFAHYTDKALRVLLVCLIRNPHLFYPALCAHGSSLIPTILSHISSVIAPLKKRKPLTLALSDKNRYPIHFLSETLLTYCITLTPGVYELFIFLIRLYDPPAVRARLRSDRRPTGTLDICTAAGEEGPYWGVCQFLSLVAASDCANPGCRLSKRQVEEKFRVKHGVTHRATIAIPTLSCPPFVKVRAAEDVLHKIPTGEPSTEEFVAAIVRHDSQFDVGRREETN